MVQPIQYQMPGVSTDPFAGVLEGIKIGATIEELQAARAQRALQAQKAEQQRRAQEAISSYLAKPQDTRTYEDTRALVPYLPAEQLKVLGDLDKTQSEEKRRNIASFYGQVGVALRNKNPDVAKQILEERIAGTQNPQERQGFELLLQSIEKAPDVAFDNLRIMMTAMGGEDYTNAAKAMFGAGKTGHRVLSPEQAKKLGLPEGNTYQQNADTGQISVLTQAKSDKIYSVLKPEQVKNLNLDPKVTYQQESGTGRITAIGQGGVTVKMPPMLGSIPPGYRVKYDGEGNPVQMEVIPGSPADAKLKSAEAATVGKTENVITQSSIVRDEIQALRDQIKEQTLASPVTGVAGAAVGQYGGVFKAGSARATAEERIKTIRANIGFDRLTQMRNESPTGGALGNITEQELAFLQSVLGSLDLGQDDKTIIKNLDRLEKIYSKIIEKAQAYPNADKYGFGKGDKPKSAQSVVVGGTTYTRPADFNDEQWERYKAYVGAK